LLTNVISSQRREAQGKPEHPRCCAAATGSACRDRCDAVPFRSHTWAGLPRGDQATLTSASVSAPMAPSFFPRRLCRPTCRAHRARGGWNHSRLCPRDIRPPKPWVCPVDISPMDILAQRQDFWVARPTLKALNQKQSLAAVHHCSLWARARAPPLPMSHCPSAPGFRSRNGALSPPHAIASACPSHDPARPPQLPRGQHKAYSAPLLGDPKGFAPMRHLHQVHHARSEADPARQLVTWP
jgi:hypothetical protein